MEKKDTLLLGAHISIAGGFSKAIERGESIGCTAIQIFTKSNRQWSAKPIKPEEALAFKSAQKNSFIKSVIAHAAYLINIASPKKSVINTSIKSLIEEVDRCQQLDIPYLVLHPGSYLEGTEKEGVARIAEHLDMVFEKVPGSTQILLETMAGQGSMLGATFEQLAEIYQRSKHKKRIGFCFDTCHAFVAGYEFNTPKSYDHLWNSFDEIIGIKHLKAMHINDSKKELGSRVDRHEDIGKGRIGLKSFELLFNDERFFDIPKILETPKDSLADDFRNMKVIESLISTKNRKHLKIMIPDQREVK